MCYSGDVWTVKAKQKSYNALQEASYFCFLVAHWWLAYYFLSTTIDIGCKLEVISLQLPFNQIAEDGQSSSNAVLTQSEVYFLSSGTTMQPS